MILSASFMTRCFFVSTNEITRATSEAVIWTSCPSACWSCLNASTSGRVLASSTQIAASLRVLRTLALNAFDSQSGAKDDAPTKRIDGVERLDGFEGYAADRLVEQWSQKG